MGRHRSIVFGVILTTAVWLSMAAAVPAPAGQPGSAVERLKTSQAFAVTSAPALSERLHELEGEQAAARSASSPGTPYVEWQSEGLTSGFDRHFNAQDALRVGTPFNFPGHWKAGRRLQEITQEWTDAGRESARVRLSAEVGQRWLELAGAIDRAAVIRDRLARLDRALALQEAKFQLGEIAGTDVVQLDLEHVRESSRLADLDAQTRALRAGLRELCAAGCAEPLEGDLIELVETTETPTWRSVSDDTIQAGAVFRSAHGETEAARARSELVSATAFGRPQIEAEWERIPSIEGLPGFDAWGFRLTVPLPIGGSGRQLRAAARAEGAAASARAQAVRRSVTRRSESLLAAAEGAANRLSALRTVVDDLAEVEHSLSEQFRLGAIRYLVYIDGLSRLDEVRLEAIAARQELLKSRLELAALLGDPSFFPVLVAMEEESSS